MPLYYMFNKPAGCVTARRDENKPTVMDYFPEAMRDVIHPIGRLDLDTEGLLILTDDGKLDFKLMQPKHHVEKKYFFRAIGYIDEKGASQLENGIELYHSDYIACQAKFELCERLKIRDVVPFLPPHRISKWLKNPDGDVTTGFLTITEGKKHQVKLMIKSVGCRVFTLKRVRLGNLELDTSLNPGEYRLLTDEEYFLLTGEPTPPSTEQKGFE